MSVPTPDPAAERAPVARRAARATKPGGPSLVSPEAGEGGKTSPQQGRERAAEGKPDPVTGAALPLLGAAPGRGRAQSPAGASLKAHGSPPAGSTGRTFTIALPAGLKLPSLNDRGHWGQRYSRAEAIRKAAWAMALQAKVPLLGRVSIVAEYQPPDRRVRDPDNVAAAAKAAIDGLRVAGVLLNDDSRHVAEVTCTIGESCPKGRLVLRLTEVAAAAGGDAA
jgi:crossover junction endodeoxyribonuclease RusA